MYGFFLEVKGDFKSEELWHRLEYLNVNLMDLDDSITVYGTTSLLDMVQVISICEHFGKVSGEFNAKEVTS